MKESVNEILSDLTPATPEEIAKGNNINQKVLIATLRFRGFSMDRIEEILNDYAKIGRTLMEKRYPSTEINELDD